MSILNFRHDALVYDSNEQFVASAVPFLGAGIVEGAAVVAITSHDNWDRLREALTDSDLVSFTDQNEWYARPAIAIASYEATLAELVGNGAPSVRVVAELPVFRTPEEWNEWTAYEAIVNRAFARQPAWIVCAYDSRVVPDDVVDNVWQTHPQVLTDGWQPNPHFGDPEHVARAFAPQLGPLPQLRPLQVGDFRTLAEQLAAEMAAGGVPQASASDMIVAAEQILANAHRHGGGVSMVRAGRVEERFVCEITDRGAGFDDPMAGYLPPSPGKEGSGLWQARQLTWRLALLPSPDGLSARLWV